MLLLRFDGMGELVMLFLRGSLLVEKDCLRAELGIVKFKLCCLTVGLQLLNSGNSPIISGRC